jgi:hypothetical protein
MFVQVIKGKAGDPEGLERQLDRWLSELKPGSVGWLGTTSGVTEDGTFLAIARFESEDKARENEKRPEQSEWWAETEKYFDGDVTFIDSSDVTLLHDGGSDDAGFVQIMQGRTTDRAKADQMNKEFAGKMKDFRPDLIGAIDIAFGDNQFLSANYFTSEAEAREGEKKQPPPEDAAKMGEFMELFKDIEYYDLKSPRLVSP